MELKLKRSQRTAGLMGGKIIFELDARLDLSAEERSLVQKYKLGKQSIYDSENRKKHADAAAGHINASFAADGEHGFRRRERHLSLRPRHAVGGDGGTFAQGHDR